MGDIPGTSENLRGRGGERLPGPGESSWPIGLPCRRVPMTCELARGINAPTLPLPASSHPLNPAGGRGGCWSSSLGTERAQKVEGGGLEGPVTNTLCITPAPGAGLHAAEQTIVWTLPPVCKRGGFLCGFVLGISSHTFVLEPGALAVGFGFRFSLFAGCGASQVMWSCPVMLQIVGTEEQICQTQGWALGGCSCSHHVLSCPNFVICIDGELNRLSFRLTPFTA